jgi:1-acyl-sn-glycerol-3-phosphate acyltransferase
VSFILNLLATIRAIIVFASMVLFMLFYGISCIVIPHSKKRALRLRENFLKYICIPVLNIHITKEGEPFSEPALYVCNHRSFTDPIVLCRYLRGFVIAKAEVAGYPIINKGAELTGVIWVDRNNQDSRTATRDKMVETIRAGYNIIVYPEGTVGKERTTLPFKKGTFMEAAANDIPVVPIAIEFQSAKDMWIKDKFVPQYLHQYSKWRTEVKLHFGSPMLHKDGTYLHNNAQRWIDDQLLLMQKNWSTAFE